MYSGEGKSEKQKNSCRQKKGVSEKDPAVRTLFLKKRRKRGETGQNSDRMLQAFVE